MRKDVIITWRDMLFDLKTLKTPTHVVTGINVDYHSSSVSIIIEKGLCVERIDLSMSHAQEIGFINVDALKKYCK